MLKKYLSAGLLMLLTLGLTWLIVNGAHAAPCPPAQVDTICAQATEPTQKVSGQALDNYGRTEFYFTKDGVALPTFNAPASSPSGGGVVSATMPTEACQTDTYSVQVAGVNTLEGKSAKSAATPNVIKNRTGEAPCVLPGVPTNPTLR